MQDRFKFRAWQKLRKRYLYDFEEDEYFGDALTDDGMVVEQCTGLKDKNGKLIYEGDIMPDMYHNGRFAVVHFDEESLGFNCGKHALFSCRSLDDLQVTGNIHENPELLEG